MRVSTKWRWPQFFVTACLGLLSLNSPVRGQADTHYQLSPNRLVANYTIEVGLDPLARTVAGSERIRWRNVTRHSTDHLLLHLYLNAFQNELSTFAQEGEFELDWNLPGEVPESYWGSLTVTSLRVSEAPGSTGNRALRHYFVQPDDGNEHDETVMRVDLEHPLKSGEEITLDLEFRSKLPRGIARTGWVEDYFFVGQWFPKIGVLEEEGWNCHQYHRNTEYYSDFGIYDVRIRVPSTYLVGATGNLRRQTEIGGQTEYRFVAEYVHDFAWTASPRFIQLQRNFQHARLPQVEVQLLLQPEHEALADRYFTAAFHGLRYYGEWFGPYPYETLTIVDPAFQSDTGGMEYPMLVTGRASFLTPDRVLSPEAVTVHEVGHQWWYGMVANNEFEETWLDEGITSWAETRVLSQVYPPPFYSRAFFGVVPISVNMERPFLFTGLSWLREGGHLDPLTRTSWQTRNRTSYRVNSYSKPELVLRTLERFMGEELFMKSMRSYFQRFAFRHPTTRDFEATFDQVSGNDWDWFFDETFRSAGHTDYSISALRSTLIPSAHDSAEPARDKGMFQSEVIVERTGDVRIPVSVKVVFDDGLEFREYWDGHAKWRRFSYQRSARVTLAEVDPDNLLLIDINPFNNSRERTPQAVSAATIRWSGRWMFWLQNFLETLGLVG